MTETCLHCGDPIPPVSDGGDGFCCKGCEGAYNLINGLGLKTYYERRTLDPDVKALRPDEDEAIIDYRAHIIEEDGNHKTLYLMVEGIHCAACVWLIETALAKQEGVLQARVNMSTRRLVLKWQDAAIDPNHLVGIINGLGYRLVPYDPGLLNSENEKSEKELLRAMAVAGFAAANVMLFSVSVWAGYSQGMLATTRDLMHWLSALVALPAVAYAGRPFFRSAITALKSGRLNMDVPISLAVLLAAGMSLYQVMTGAEHAYFDSAISLLFFLLIGRYLDRRARGKARGAAEHLLGLNAVAVTVLNDDGTKSLIPPDQVVEGMTVLSAAGERIAIDGTIIEGQSDIDTSLISGESLPTAAKVEDQVFAGTTNLSAPLKIKVTATGEGTLLAEIVRLMEEAEAGRANYVALADRVARYYAPVVHFLALITFVYWFFIDGALWNEALLHAIAVLIITCPCALALAVPVVQVIASGRLLRQGILVKTGTALERFAQIKNIVFDKTGTLTLGRAELVNRDDLSNEHLELAASLAGASKHPLSRALCRAVPHIAIKSNVIEVPGCGLELDDIRLGSRAWCGREDAPLSDGPELWLAIKDQDPICFKFADHVRSDAKEILNELHTRGYATHLLSGDRIEPVKHVAGALAITDWKAQCTPRDKCDELEKLDTALMVGDGLNDAPALAAAHVSLSPSTAIDVSQTAADAVFQGDRLKPVLEVLGVANKAEQLVKQNFALAFLYNSVTIPLAIAGYVTPLIAAVAMSTSSLVVIANALRLSRGKV
ncbi:heavy metal translocating P-type ATPase metal-binding domain-containing protein [Terasakiella sp. A23]|uniref:heavy metal translocating P-type ATPase n=1 Tax=Terasakiella sp. FCG-A23 TaxID=3080561 RepID=UPI0029529F56|nr:heavy metal translocating P-type ATPase metal-binding domain-containing protein [Terasakiella sp. A23]MDV7341146.1 heavy metal translocating P-type ATPase metal-binding domain-containing protein [Terasakiella sp. A23]